MNDWARVYELSGHLYLLLTALPVRSDYIALLSRGEGVSLRPDATLCSEGENAQTGTHRKRAAVAETAWSLPIAAGAPYNGRTNCIKALNTAGEWQGPAQSLATSVRGTDM